MMELPLLIPIRIDLLFSYIPIVHTEVSGRLDVVARSIPTP